MKLDEVDKKLELLNKPYGEWTDTDLLEQLTKSYEEVKVPPCRVCGGELSPQSIGGGGPIKYACSGYIDGPDGERVRAEGRTVVDKHYVDSEWDDYRQGGDGRVMELLKRHFHIGDDGRVEEAKYYTWSSRYAVLERAPGDPICSISPRLVKEMLMIAGPDEIFDVVNAALKFRDDGDPENERSVYVAVDALRDAREKAHEAKHGK